MPLKKSNAKKRTSAKVTEGKTLQTPDGNLMSLFTPAMLPAITLNIEQFAFPENFLVRKVDRKVEYERDPQTGWDWRDASGNKKMLNAHYVDLLLASGTAAQKMADEGETDFSTLNTVECKIMKDIPLQEFEVDTTLIKLVNPVVMLNYGGSSVNRLVLVAEDCKLV